MVSIIIPTFNRFDQLDRTLYYLSLLETDYNLYEIIVVDNGSTDTTKSIVESYQKKCQDLDLSYYYDAEPGLLTGRHLGADKAKGDILTFIDDDIHVSASWLDTIIEVTNKDSEVIFLTGPNLPKYETYPPNWLDYFWKTEINGKSCAWLSLLDLGDKVQEISPNYVWGLNFTIRKAAFIELGGFHPDCIPSQFQMFQGDGETGLTIKGIEKDMKALYHPKIMIYHEVTSARLTFEYFEKRAYYSGIGDSYFKLRLDNNLYKKKKPEKLKKQTYTKKYINSFKTIIKKIIFKNTKIIIPTEIVDLKNRFEIKRKEGFDFHQKQFNETINVKEWVLKNNYFNFKLPNS